MTLASQPTSAATAAAPAGAFDPTLLRRVVRGSVSTPADADYETARLPWRLSADQRPLAVVAPVDAADVVVTVRLAREHGVCVTAQPGGHGATSALSGTILLRTRTLGGIEVDPEARVARVGAGVKWGELLAATSPYGLAGLAGSTGDTTVVGLSLGGGLSWFGRRHGFPANSVLAVDLVDPTGELVRVTHESDPELFWALRGGGGDFGIVTAVEVQLFDTPELYGGRLFFAPEHSGAVFRTFSALARTAPDELTLWANLMQFPPMPDLPEHLRGKAFATVDLTYLGSAAEAERLIAPLRAAAPVLMETVAQMDVANLSDICAEPTDPLPDAGYSVLVDDLTDDAINALFAVAHPETRSPLLVVQVRHLGGAMAREAEGGGAVGHTRERFLLNAIGIPATPQIGAAIAERAALLRESMKPFARRGRAPYNFLDATEGIERVFPADVLSRLQLLKVERDPTGTIRSNRPLLG